MNEAVRADRRGAARPGGRGTRATLIELAARAGLRRDLVAVWATGPLVAVAAFGRLAAAPSACGGAGDLFADCGGPPRRCTQPWPTLPDVDVALAELAGSTAGRALLIAVAVDGRWSPWAPRGPAPPVPAAAGR